MSTRTIHPCNSALRFSNANTSARRRIASADRSPCATAFIRARSFPSTVRGPVDRSHGLTRRAFERREASPACVSL